MSSLARSDTPGGQSNPSRIRWSVVAVGFLAVLLDGFDASALAFTVPTLAKEWGIEPASFTAPLVLTNLGVVGGYVSSGWLGARMGRRNLLLAGVALFGIATLLTAMVLPLESIVLLTILRLVTGFGLGIVLPVSVSLAADHSPVARRELVTVLVTLGLTSGATLGGFFGGALIRGIGVSGVFWVAGILPVILLVFVHRIVKEPVVDGSAATPSEEAKVSRLFASGLKVSTMALWSFAFVIFLAQYTLLSWIPTLLIGFGFSPTEAPLGLAFFSLGGLVGGILLIPLAGRFGTARVLIGTTAVGGTAILAAALLPLSSTALLLVLAIGGAGVTAGLIGQLAIAVALYPPKTRTTGIGWAAALGRAGSIVGPAFAGVLLSMNLPGQQIVLLTTIPILLAAAMAVALWLRLRSGSSTPAVDKIPYSPAGTAGSEKN